MKKLTKLFIFPQLLFYIGYRIRKTIISLYVFTGCSSSIPENIDEVNIPENLTIIENSLYQIFHEIDGCLKPAEPVYQLVVNEPHPSQRYLENLYAEYLIENERNTFQISEEYMSAVPSAEKNGEVVSVILQKLDIDYLFILKKNQKVRNFHALLRYKYFTGFLILIPEKYSLQKQRINTTATVSAQKIS